MDPSLQRRDGMVFPLSSSLSLLSGYFFLSLFFFFVFFLCFFLCFSESHTSFLPSLALLSQPSPRHERARHPPSFTCTHTHTHTNTRTCNSFCLQRRARSSYASRPPLNARTNKESSFSTRKRKKLEIDEPLLPIVSRLGSQFHTTRASNKLFPLEATFSTSRSIKMTRI